MSSEFEFRNDVNPHPARSREMIKKYPQIRTLMGHYPISFIYLSALTVIQLGIAYLLREQSWPLIILSAYLLGALLNHALFVFVHEASHNLIFSGNTANILAGILSNVAQGAPTSYSFRIFHLIHHANMSELNVDADLPFKIEAQIVSNSWWRKTLWFIFFGLVEGLRPLNIKKRPFSLWIVTNFVIIFATDYLIYTTLGPKALAYLLLSTLFSVGLHPVGARWIQEHYIYKKDQFTYSYYGILNKLQFNIGLHNEHHDFFRIAWNKLPALKKMAPEYYENLYYHTSWTRLLFDFIFNPQRNLFARYVKIDSKA